MPETDRFDCKLCNESNSAGDMVYCEACQEWFHYGCVGVTSAVAADDSWMCAICLSLPSSTRIGALIARSPELTATRDRIIAANQSVVSETNNSGTSATNSVVTTTVTDTSRLQSTTTTTSDTVSGQYLLTEQARLSLQWINEQRKIFEQQLEEASVQEIQRRKAMLSRIADSAIHGVINGREGGGSGQQSGVVGDVGGSWLGRMIGEMRDLSIAPLNATASSSEPIFNNSSSTPTTAGAAIQNTFDPHLSSMQGTSGYSVNALNSSIPIPATITDPALPGYSLMNLNNYGTLGTRTIDEGLGPLASYSNPAPIPLTSAPALSLQNSFPALQSWNPIPDLPNPRLTNPAPTPSFSQPTPLPRPTITLPALFPPNSTQRPLPYPRPVPPFPAPTSLGPNPSLLPLPEIPPNPPPRLPNPAPVPLPVIPTPQQLLARQVMPKDLPTFRGDPEDWPLFYCAYVNSTNACGYSNVENLARLQRALQGRAFNEVRSRLLFPSCVPQVMATLYMMFGRPELIIHTLLEKVRNVATPKADKLETLITFGLAVQNLCDHIEATGQEAHMHNPVLIQELVDKLPAQQRLNWAIFKRQCAVVADLRTFASYMSVLVAAASDVTITMSSKRSGQTKEKNFLNAHSTDEISVVDNEEAVEQPREIKEVTCLVCNGTGHKVKDCVTFQNCGSERRWKLVQDHHLCRTCLGKHGRRPCRLQTRCGVNGCQDRHHQLLHLVRDRCQLSTDVGKNPVEHSGSGNGLSAHHATEKTTMFRILPVKLSWKNNSVETFAFLDDGSDMTLVEQSIADQLGIDDGEPLPLCLTWTSNVTRKEPNSQRIRVEVSGEGKSERYVLNNTRTVESLDLPKQSLNFVELTRRYPYLRGIPVSSYQLASPGILIGSNNASLIATLNLREGELGEPLASKTRLGWSVYGHTDDRKKATSFTLHVCACRDDQNTDKALHDLVKQHFEIESVGVRSAKGPESDEDKRARNILESTTKRVSTRFETGLLWRHDSVELPNSFPMAMRRFDCFEKRLKKDPELRASVRKQIKEYLENKYIHEVTADELAETDPCRTWYLPLGVVSNPKKPGKIRLVWDAAAKVAGISLNTMLLKGPDMLTPLASVLCKFRERPVAVSGDTSKTRTRRSTRRRFHKQPRLLSRDTTSMTTSIASIRRRRQFVWPWR